MLLLSSRAFLEGVRVFFLTPTSSWHHGKVAQNQRRKLMLTLPKSNVPPTLRSLLSPTVSDRKLAFPSGSERFCSETLISARNAASVKSEPIFEIARNFSEHIPINSEQLVGITRI